MCYFIYRYMNLNEEFLTNNEFSISIEEDFKKLYRDTAHFSSYHMMRDTDIYQKLLNYGDKVVPYLVDKILNDQLYIGFYDILLEIVNFNIKDDNRGNIIKMKDDVLIWWNLNKKEYSIF